MRHFIFTLSILFCLCLYGQVSPLKNQNHLIEGVENYQLLVKFKAKDINLIENKKAVFNPNVRLNSSTFNQINQLSFTSVFEFSEKEKYLFKQGELPTPPPGCFNKYQFKGLAYVDSIQHLNKHQLLSLANDLEALDIVEYVVLEPIYDMPVPMTPDYTYRQDYILYAHPTLSSVLGVDMEYAWGIGIYGQGIRIADIEKTFNYEHEDLVSPNYEALVTHPNPASLENEHGTAVAGIMFAKNNGFGVTGLVHGADKFYGVSENRFGRSFGIVRGMESLRRGDVFIYEMQTAFTSVTLGDYIPADYSQAVWDVTKFATDSGIVVIAAAGNGNMNLDDSGFDAYRARGDNGSIIVGAGTRSGRNKASFSTYGSPVHVQGWGDWTVATTGYGDLYSGGENAKYTRTFSGTSSATPIVASVAVAVQSYLKANNRPVLSSTEMRELLISTGTPQGSGGHIGPLPNVRRAIEALTIPLDYNLALQSVQKINSNLCGLTLDYSLDILNRGVQSIQNCELDVYINNNLQQTFSLEPNLQSNQIFNYTASLNLPSSGNYTLKFVVKNPNNFVDEDEVDNEKEITTEVYEGIEHQFFITQSEHNPNYVWTIQINEDINLNNELFSQNSTNNYITQNFCLLPDCYVFNAQNLYLTSNCNFPTWEESSVYLGDSGLGAGNGNKVIYNGNIYRALWWTQGDIPSNDGPWVLEEACVDLPGDGEFGIKNLNDDELFKYNFTETDEQFQTNFCVESLITNAQVVTDNLKPQVYPNPIVDYVDIQFIAFNSHSLLKVYDISGKLIFEKEVLADAIRLKTQHWKSGIYIIVIQNQSKINSFRCIK